MTQRDPYAVLGVADDATTEEIAAAHRALARRFHPDVSTRPDAQHRMAEINVAWDILRDPDRRALWTIANRPPSQRVPDLATHPGPGAAQGGSRRGNTPRPTTGGAGGPQWRRGPFGEGAAGPPPGRPSGTVLPFGRHIGWSLGEVARVDAGYLAWLRDRREGAPYRTEIDRLLASMRPAQPGGDVPRQRRRGLFR